MSQNQRIQKPGSVRKPSWGRSTTGTQQCRFLAAAQLRGEGYAVGRKLVRSYMQEMGIHAVYPKPNLSKRNFTEAIVPYLLRNKVVSFLNQVWSIDITYIKDRKSVV